MEFYKSDEFLDKVLSHVKFSYDRSEIRLELQGHILDRLDFYIEKGYSEEEAEKLAIEQMGDPTEIGIELNKQHNPIIGWIWRITNIAVVLSLFLSIFTAFMLFMTVAMTIFSSNPIKIIPKDSIVYQIDLREEVQIDDRVIKFTNVIYDNEGDMHIVYKYYDKKFWKTGWSFGSIGKVYDDLGNEYFSGSGSSTVGYITKGIRTLRGFSPEAKALIIDYDSYNRSYKVEVPLEAGENNE